MPRSSRLALYAIALSLVAGTLLSACDVTPSLPGTPTAILPNVGPTPAIPVPTPNDPTTLTSLAAGVDPASLDPALDYEAVGVGIIVNVYEPLLAGMNNSADQFIPMLADRMPDISDGGRTYTFHIRKGVKFQEGQDLTPEDVAYSFWRGMIQDAAGGPQWMILQPFFGLDVQSFKDGVVTAQYKNDWVAACEAVRKAITFDNSADTVTMHLKQPYGPTLQILSGPWGSIVSKSWVTGLGGWNGDCATAEKYHDPKPEADELYKVMNGTGPYKLERWTPGQELSLVRNDNYWAKTPLWNGGPSGPARIRRVVFQQVPEWSTRLAMLKAGDADFAGVDPQYYPQLDQLVAQQCDYAADNCTAANPGGFLREWRGIPSHSSWYMPLNQQVNATGGNNRIGSGKLDGNGVPPDFFSDIHVRKAFNYSYDWKTFIDQGMQGDAEQALGPIPNGVLGYDPNQPHYTYDLAKAAEEFKASTLKSPDGKSLWDTGFLLQFVYASGTDNALQQGNMLKQSLAKINPKFRLEVADEPWPAMLKESGDLRLPIQAGGWGEDFHDPHDWVQPLLGSNGSSTSSPRFPQDVQSKIDDLIAQAVHSTDTNTRVGIYKQLQNTAYENALYIFTVQPHDRNYEPLWLNGWRPSPVTRLYGTYYYSLSKGQ